MIPTDIEQLKRSADILAVLGSATTLRQETRTELSGPCPKCGGDDRFHLHVAEGWFFCRECHPKRGDVIELVQFLGQAHGFVQACEYLGASRPSQTQPSTRVGGARPQEQLRIEPTWRAPDWQHEARTFLTSAQANLEGEDGEPGRNYLLGRSIQPATWRAWGLGHAHIWDRRQERKRPAIVFPWQREKITAMQYRFIDAQSKGDRFLQRTGGERIAFGLQLCGEHYGTLWLVEGETNCLSLWQCLSSANMVNVDALSYGSQSNVAQNEAIVKLTKRYRQVIIWADEPEVVRRAETAIPNSFGVKSILREGVKLDANALLQQDALLPFIRRLWARFDSDPGHVGRCRAELE